MNADSNLIIEEKIPLCDDERYYEAKIIRLKDHLKNLFSVTITLEDSEKLHELRNTYFKVINPELKNIEPKEQHRQYKNKYKKCKSLAEELHISISDPIEPFKARDEMIDILINAGVESDYIQYILADAGVIAENGRLPRANIKNKIKEYDEFLCILEEKYNHWFS